MTGMTALESMARRVPNITDTYTREGTNENYVILSVKVVGGTAVFGVVNLTKKERKTLGLGELAELVCNSYANALLTGEEKIFYESLPEVKGAKAQTGYIDKRRIY